MKEIIDKLDRLDERLDAINVTLAKQEVSLSEHIRRTALAEKNISRLDGSIRKINVHVHRVQGVFKFLLGLGGMSGFLGGLWLIAKSYLKNS